MDEFKQRKNHRLKNYDYSKSGYYFVTICTKNKEKLLSDISTSVVSDALVAPKIIPTKLGEEIINCWNNIAKTNKNIKLDRFVMMPNHIHGIIIIDNHSEDAVDMSKKYSFEIPERRGRRSLQGIVKDFKSVSTRIYKKMYSTNTSLWQESFYDEIIRSSEHYYKVALYIEHNPRNWIFDEYY